MKKAKQVLGVFLSVCMIISCMTGLTFTVSADDDPRIIIGLGDSYSSGEGVGNYFGEDKPLDQKFSDPDFLAHRSKDAWSGKLKLSGEGRTYNVNWFFAAASGAITDDLTGNQKINYYRDYGEQGKYSGTFLLDPQLDVFNGRTLTANDFVTISIGGNDVGFTDIMVCAIVEAVKKVSPYLIELIVQYSEEYRRFTEITTADYINEKKAEFIKENGTRTKIKAALRKISDKSGDAVILVAGYPKLFNVNGFTFDFGGIPLTLTAEDCKTINDGVVWLNTELSNIVDECADEGMNIYFVDVTDAFKDHEAYTDDPYINGVIVGATNPQEVTTMSFASSHSIHPNEKGASAYASAEQAKIDEIDKDAPAHTHSWSYSASGAVLTATCGNTGCPFPDNKVSFTIEKPAHEKYGDNGTANASLEGVNAFNTATELSVSENDIKYVGTGDTVYAESYEAPTMPGTYSARITVEDKTAAAAYTIEKADGPAMPADVAVQSTAATIKVVLPEQVDEKYEFKLDNKAWTTNSAFTGLAPGTNHTVLIREKETSTTKAGEASTTEIWTDYDVTISGKAVAGQTIKAEALPADETNQRYQWLRDGVEITGAKVKTYFVGAADIGHRLSVVVRSAVDNISGTSTETVEVTKDTQSVPTGITGFNETYEGSADGRITGVNSTMEYRRDNETTYTAITGTTITGLSAGTYKVRYKETEIRAASPDIDAVVNTGSKITVLFNTDGGSPVPVSQECEYGQTAEKPGTDPVKLGCTFKFWSADGDNEYDFETKLTGNITLTAKWKYDSPEQIKPVVKAEPGSGTVTLSWNPVIDADRYAAYFYDPVEKTTTVIASNIKTTAYTVKGLTNGETYYFLVRARTTKWTPFDETDIVEVTLANDRPVVKATPGNRTATLEWDKIKDAEKYAAYLVQEDNSLKALATKITDTSYTVKKLTNGETYTFLVRAFVYGKWSKYTEADFVECRIPSGRPEVTATPGDSMAKLAWVAIDGATKYAAYIEQEDGTMKCIASKITDTTYTVKKLTNDETYRFLVRAYANGTWTKYAKSDIVECTPVSKAPVPTATPGDKKVTLAWDAVEGAEKYAAYTVDAEGNLKILNSKLVDTTYTARKLTNNTEYTFLVRAYVDGKWTTYTEANFVKATPGIPN